LTISYESTGTVPLVVAVFVFALFVLTLFTVLFALFDEPLHIENKKTRKIKIKRRISFIYHLPFTIYQIRLVNDK